MCEGRAGRPPARHTEAAPAQLVGGHAVPVDLQRTIQHLDPARGVRGDVPGQRRKCLVQIRRDFVVPIQQHAGAGLGRVPGQHRAIDEAAADVLRPDAHADIGQVDQFVEREVGFDRLGDRVPQLRKLADDALLPHLGPQRAQHALLAA